ncbi:hypothetical protein LCGC14_1117400 [marine sediment metagenome]|uniref:Uncharacterized protein n=1 Tax=marine sediment metagenome TaxID=412755 RepID=A0A0F9QAS8_9ZZZZ
MELMIAKKDGEHLTRIPDVGDNIPDGWELKEELFVDSNGLGSDYDPALSIDQFYDKVKAGFGYATTDAGQFQVHVGVFERI